MHVQQSVLLLSFSIETSFLLVSQSNTLSILSQLPPVQCSLLAASFFFSAVICLWAGVISVSVRPLQTHTCQRCFQFTYWVSSKGTGALYQIQYSGDSAIRRKYSIYLFLSSSVWLSFFWCFSNTHTHIYEQQGEEWCESEILAVQQESVRTQSCSVSE